jgi:hypothetical protein
VARNHPHDLPAIASRVVDEQRHVLQELAG